MTKTWAPAPGADPAFDEMARKMLDGLEAAGNPEGIDEDAAREILAKNFATHTGKTWAIDPAEWIDVPGNEPVVTPAQVRELRIPAVPTEPYWYEDVEQAEMFDHYVLSRRALGGRVQGGLLITGPAGCLAGDTLINTNRGGKGRAMRLDHIVSRVTGNGPQIGRPWDESVTMMIARADGDVVRLGKMSNAWYSGDKVTFTLTTNSGRSIRATATHPFLSPNGGWRRLGTLSPGDEVYVNGGRSKRGLGAKRQYRALTTRFHPYQTANSRRDSDFKVSAHRLAVEAQMNKMPTEAFQRTLLADPSAAASFRYLDPSDEVHHLDGNPRNNDLDNLVVMSGTEHARHHGLNGHGNHVLWQIDRETIASIEFYGIEPTYDIEMADEPHNFLANGFVVHNSGKTKGVVKAIERINAEHGLDIPLLVMNCPTVNDPGKWFGRREIDETGSRYEKSDFIAAVESGGVILLDEFMRLHPTIHNPVMSLMDATEAVLLSDLNLLVTRHPQTIFIGTTNIGSAFGGTHRMDWAMRERWSFTIEREFPPEDEEIKILVTNNPGCGEAEAKALVEIAAATRRMYADGRDGGLRSPISTRTLDNAAFLVASGMTVRAALHWTAIPEYDGNADGGTGSESDREKVKRAIEGKGR